jgi:hypothetical protein
MSYILDLDDHPDGDCLPRLLELKKILPKLKLTLFAIPIKMTKEKLEEIEQYDWIQLAVHGFEHEGNYEFAYLNKEGAEVLITTGYDSLHYVKGFKAPGWQISQGTMEALKEMGFWVAVQWSDDRLNGDPNGPYQPAVIEGLKYYAWREYPNAIHGHTWECCGNGLGTLWARLIALPPDSEFLFIDDYVKTKNLLV